MLKKLSLIFSIISLVLIAGCEQQSTTPKTAILDLDAIAKATGQADIIKQQIDAANNELNTQLSAISSKLQEQLTSEKESMGKKISKEEQQKLDQLTRLANQKMQQARNIASQKSQQYRVALIQKLRQTINPIAESIARKRNADMVIAANNSTVWFNPESDITDEVIAEMRARAISAPVKTEATQQDPAEESKDN